MTFTPNDFTIGEIYSVHHQRKGYFVGELMAIVPTPDGDPQDHFFLTMKIDTRKGTDQEHLANAGEGVALKNIRPSLVLSYQVTTQSDWLRTVHLPQVLTDREIADQQVALMKQAVEEVLTKQLSQPGSPSLLDRLLRRPKTH